MADQLAQRILADHFAHREAEGPSLVVYDSDGTPYLDFTAAGQVAAGALHPAGEGFFETLTDPLPLFVLAPHGTIPPPSVGHAGEPAPARGEGPAPARAPVVHPARGPSSPDRAALVEQIYDALTVFPTDRRRRAWLAGALRQRAATRLADLTDRQLDDVLTAAWLARRQVRDRAARLVAGQARRRPRG